MRMLVTDWRYCWSSEGVDDDVAVVVDDEDDDVLLFLSFVADADNARLTLTSIGIS